MASRSTKEDRKKRGRKRSRKASTTKPTSERNYRKEYDTYHKSAEQRKRRSQRTVARNKAIKAGKVKKGDGKELDHKNFDTSDNSEKNVRVVSRKKNREHQPKHKKYRRYSKRKGK